MGIRTKPIHAGQSSINNDNNSNNNNNNNGIVTKTIKKTIIGAYPPNVRYAMSRHFPPSPPENFGKDTKILGKNGKNRPRPEINAL